MSIYLKFDCDMCGFDPCGPCNECPSLMGLIGSNIATVTISVGATTVSRSYSLIPPYSFYDQNLSSSCTINFTAYPEDPPQYIKMVVVINKINGVCSVLFNGQYIDLNNDQMASGFTSVPISNFPQNEDFSRSHSYILNGATPTPITITISRN